MEYMKTPILNDTLYNASKNHIIPENSIALHSAVLKFTLENEKYSFSSDVPSFFNRVLDV
jgi:23S rRNA-/tRNA-specific pseudouridylate synthase